MNLNYSNNCTYSIRLVEKLKSIDIENNLDFDLINKAIYWAKKYHDGQYRKSGEPFYTHPLEVAYMVSDYKLTTDVVVTSILHDIIEDTEVTAGMILDDFGWRITEMVDRLTRDRPDGSKLTVEEILTNAYFKQDDEVLLIKCADRLHNMLTLSAKNKDKQAKTSHETFDIFIVYAMYIENKHLYQSLYDLCSKYLYITKSNDKLSQLDESYSYLSLTKNTHTHQLVSQVFRSAILQ